MPVLVENEKRVQIFKTTENMYKSDPVLVKSLRDSIEHQRIYWEGEHLDLPDTRFAEKNCRSSS